MLFLILQMFGVTEMKTLVEPSLLWPDLEEAAPACSLAAERCCKVFTLATQYLSSAENKHTDTHTQTHTQLNFWFDVSLSHVFSFEKAICLVMSFRLGQQCLVKK